jgi:hypothetical protein
MDGLLEAAKRSRRTLLEGLLSPKQHVNLDFLRVEILTEAVLAAPLA